MPEQTTPGIKRKSVRRARQPVIHHVLVVDDEADIRTALADALRSRRMRPHTAASEAEAKQIIARQRIDVMLIDLALPDGDGIELAEQLRRDHPSLQSIVITGQPTTARAIAALRAGSCDFLAKPIDLDQLRRSVRTALMRQADAERKARRIHRLRNLCRQLNRARHEVTQQVDILCNDLVSAYQDLAGQMKQVQSITRFKTMIEHELDLEQLLRKALEFLLQQVGPTNAVIFLPAVSGGFSTGGYINYSFDRKTAEVLLDHLADVVAPRIAESEHLEHMTDDAEINLWLSDDSAWLSGSEIATMPCRHEGETLGGILLFRDADEPFDIETLKTISDIGPALATHLAKVIGIHHRMADYMQDLDDDDDDREDYGGTMFI